MGRERTLAIIKPDAVRQRVIGAIVQRYEQEGFRIVEMTPLGYPEREGRLTSRKELTEIVFHDRFGQ